MMSEESLKELEEWLYEEEKPATREHKPPEEKPKARVRVKVEAPPRYRIQVIMGIIGGIILFIVGAVGSAGFYEVATDYAISMGIIPAEYGGLFMSFLKLLALGGGLTVIVGSLMIPKIRGLGNWLIGIGAGISLISVLTKVFLLGPVIQQYVSQSYNNVSYLFEALRLLGVEIGVMGLGVLLSFMATFERYRWTIVIGIMSFCSMLAGLSADPKIFEYIRSLLGIPPEYGIYVEYLVRFLMYIGAVLLVIALLAGAGYIGLSKSVIIICMIATIFPVISIILDFTSISSYLSIHALVQYIRMGSAIGVYVGGIYFIRKA